MYATTKKIVLSRHTQQHETGKQIVSFLPSQALYFFSHKPTEIQSATDTLTVIASIIIVGLFITHGPSYTKPTNTPRDVNTAPCEHAAATVVAHADVPCRALSPYAKQAPLLPCSLDNLRPFSYLAPVPFIANVILEKHSARKKKQSKHKHALKFETTKEEEYQGRIFFPHIPKSNLVWFY